MIKPDDIHKSAGLSKEQKLRFEKTMQQDDLSYLSSLAFEQFSASNSDIEALNKRIDKKTGNTPGNFNTILVSMLCGLFIGVSIFFVIFQKSKTHASVFESLEPDKPQPSLNNVMATDTVFPEQIQPVPKVVEHYSSTSNQAEEPAVVIDLPEPMSTKSIAFSEPEKENNEDIILSFSPNAPVVFISNLKVTNYRMYYFKQSQSIDLSINTGLAAQYEVNANIEHERLNYSDSYIAHKIIQRAMKLFNLKHYVNCIEELNLLYEFNKNDANAQFYLGMCYFLTGKYALAQLYFQKNLDNDNNIFHQESEFYQAMCFLNTKQTDKATQQLQSIVNSKGFYSKRAQEVLSKQ
ncbi:MAG: tetratricopeptide repeat protein [Bacteroidota bacterium]